MNFFAGGEALGESLSRLPAGDGGHEKKSHDYQNRQ
jgi:hypothetical protein